MPVSRPQRSPGPAHRGIAACIRSGMPAPAPSGVPAPAQGASSLPSEGLTRPSAASRLSALWSWCVLRRRRDRSAGGGLAGRARRERCGTWEGPNPVKPGRGRRAEAHRSAAAVNADAQRTALCADVRSTWPVAPRRYSRPRRDADTRCATPPPAVRQEHLGTRGALPADAMATDLPTPGAVPWRLRCQLV